MPHTEVTKKGKIKYSEVVHKNVVNLKPMSRRWPVGTLSGAVNIQKVQDDVLELWSVVKALPEISSDQKNRIESLYEGSLNIHLKRMVSSTWEYRSNLTSVYLDILHEMVTSGTTFKDKNGLLTGVGKGSIGVKVIKGLLSGVVIMTSSHSHKTIEYYQSIFQSFGSRGLTLTVVPFNQALKQDLDQVVVITGFA